MDLPHRYDAGGACMFICAFKPKRKHLVFGGLIMAAAICAVCLFSCKGESASVMKKANLSAATNEERVAFLEQFGWEVKAEAVQVKDVVIPAEFSDVYKKYNEIQTAQGFDLSDYHGKQVKQYAYAVTNYPGYEGEVRANLLVYAGNVIGGDICSLTLDGFMHGFKMPSQK